MIQFYNSMQFNCFLYVVINCLCIYFIYQWIFKYYYSLISLKYNSYYAINYIKPIIWNPREKIECCLIKGGEEARQLHCVFFMQRLDETFLFFSTNNFFLKKNIKLIFFNNFNKQILKIKGFKKLFIFK